MKQNETDPCNSIITLSVTLSLVLRYFHALYLGAQSHWHGSSPGRHFHWRLMFESADITMLRLLEAFLKSAPQLVLQLSIMIHGNAVLPLQGERKALKDELWSNQTVTKTSRTVGGALHSELTPANATRWNIDPNFH